MACKQLAEARDREFKAETFEEMAKMSKKHAVEMAQKNDKGHIEKMEEMTDLMNKPEAMNEWFEKVQKEFDSLPEDSK